MSNLQERFELFAKDSVAFCRSLPRDVVTVPLISQFVRSSTGVGANYMEAQNAISRKEFRSKVYISKKEAQESLYWLKLLEQPGARHQDVWTKLYTEAEEITRILQAITKKLTT